MISGSSRQGSRRSEKNLRQHWCLWRRALNFLWFSKDRADDLDRLDPRQTHSRSRPPCGEGRAIRQTDDRRGSHGPTIDRPPLAGLGGRPPGLRADPGQRLQGAGPAPEPRPGRRLRPVLPGRLGRRAGRARPGWPTSSSTCSSRGPSGSPRGRSTAWRSSPPASRTPRPARTAPITGSPSRPTAGSWPWRSRPTGCAGRPSTRARSRPSGT